VHGLSFWRSPDYYVDPTSTKLIELGTKEYPFKSLMLPFVEILNYHSHSNFSVNIYVQERTTVEIFLDSIYLINIERVNLINYSNATSSPDQANLVIKDGDVNIWSPKTRFNLFKNYDLDLNVQLNNGNITDRERIDFLRTGYAFMVNRANFKMWGFTVTTSFTNSSVPCTLFYPIFIQDKVFELENLQIEGTEGILYTRDPLNFYAKNIDIDYSEMKKGFEINSECNYVGASHQTNVVFTNIVAYNSKERLVQMKNSFINFFGPANFKLEGSSINIYGTKLQNFAPIKYDANQACNPNDSTVQKFEIYSNTLSLKQSANNDRFIQIRVNILSDYKRKVEINLYNNKYEGLINNYEQLHQITGSKKTTLNVSNITMSSFTFFKNVFDYSTFEKISFTFVSIQNLTYFGESLININAADRVEINSVIIDKCTISNNKSLYYIHVVEAVTNKYIYLNSIVFKNTDLNNMKGLSLNTGNNFTLNNSQFSNLTIGQNSFLSFGTVGGLNLNNLTFTQISADDDVESLLIDVGSILLNSTLSSQITEVSISDSKLPFVNFDKTTGITSELKTLLISNFKYENSYFTNENNLLTFSGKLKYLNYFNRNRINFKFWNSLGRF
jgi:hypothetical protein